MFRILCGLSLFMVVSCDGYGNHDVYYGGKEKGRSGTQGIPNSGVRHNIVDSSLVGVQSGNLFSGNELADRRSHGNFPVRSVVQRPDNDGRIGPHIPTVGSSHRNMIGGFPSVGRIGSFRSSLDRNGHLFDNVHNQYSAYDNSYSVDTGYGVNTKYGYGANPGYQVSSGYGLNTGYGYGLNTKYGYDVNPVYDGNSGYGYGLNTGYGYGPETSYGPSTFYGGIDWSNFHINTGNRIDSMNYDLNSGRGNDLSHSAYTSYGTGMPNNGVSSYGTYNGLGIDNAVNTAHRESIIDGTNSVGSFTDGRHIDGISSAFDATNTGPVNTNANFDNDVNRHRVQGNIFNGPREISNNNGHISLARHNVYSKHKVY